MIPPPAAAAESTSRSCWSCGGWPSSSSRPPAVDTATAVPIVSKKSLTKRTKITGTSAQRQRVGEVVGGERVADRREVACSGNCATLSGPSRTPKISPRTVEARMPSRIAPRTPRAVEDDHHQQARQRDHRRAAGQDAQADPGRVVVDRDARVAEADERDEEADADADRELDLHRDGAHDRLAQAGDHQDQRDHALDDDARHRHRPRQVAAEDQVERDDGVEAEARGQGERQVGQQAHGEREDRRGQRRGHRDGVERQSAPRVMIRAVSALRASGLQ